MTMVYMLRRDLLPENYDYNTILAMDEQMFVEEMNRQCNRYVELFGKEENFIAIYGLVDFEDLINLEDGGGWNPSNYYIRFFEV